MTSQSAQVPPFDCDLRRLGNVKRGEVGRRSFVLRAAVSLLAGVVTQLFGPQAGGLFLAFPAILLATLTLLEKTEGRAAAVASSEGAVLGAIGLAVFAFVFEAAIANSALGSALVLALTGWIGTSVALYAAVERSADGSSSSEEALAERPHGLSGVEARRAGNGPLCYRLSG